MSLANWIAGIAGITRDRHHRSANNDNFRLIAESVQHGSNDCYARISTPSEPKPGSSGTPAYGSEEGGFSLLTQPYGFAFARLGLG